MSKDINQDIVSGAASLNRFEAVRQRVQEAAQRAGRRAEEITIIGVTKKHFVPVFEPLLQVGHKDFGENRVQEAQSKWPALLDTYPGTRLHLIGPLQTNKVRAAVELFDVIHTVDRVKLAAKLKDVLEETGAQPELFVQINTGEEPQKAGIAPAQADDFITACRDEFGLTISGVMCIPPTEEEPAPHFALLTKISERNNLDFLSMGMSDDFETAIEFGATHIRLGTTLFGPRPVSH